MEATGHPTAAADSPLASLAGWLPPLRACLVVEAIVLGLGARTVDGDGYHTASAYFASRGLIPYADFPYGQGPLTLYLWAPAMRLLGPGLWVTRLVGVAHLLLLYAACCALAARKRSRVSGRGEVMRGSKAATSAPWSRSRVARVRAWERRSVSVPGL